MAANTRVRIEPDIEQYLRSQGERVLGIPADKLSGADITTLTNRLLYEHKLAQTMMRQQDLRNCHTRSLIFFKQGAWRKTLQVYVVRGLTSRGKIAHSDTNSLNLSWATDCYKQLITNVGSKC